MHSGHCAHTFKKSIGQLVRAFFVGAWYVHSHQKAVLEQRLTHSTTGQNLLEEARRLGYVRPGEHLFIVHGVKEWLKAHAQPGG